MPRLIVSLKSFLCPPPDAFPFVSAVDSVRLQILCPRIPLYARRLTRDICPFALTIVFPALYVVPYPAGASFYSELFLTVALVLFFLF